MNPLLRNILELRTKQDFIESSKRKRHVDDNEQGRANSSPHLSPKQNSKHRTEDSNILSKSVKLKIEKPDYNSDPSPKHQRHDSDSNSSPPEKRHDSDSDHSPLR